MKNKPIKKLQSIIERYNELSQLMSLPDAMQNMKQYTTMAREHNSISQLVENAQEYIVNHKQLVEYEEILNGDKNIESENNEEKDSKDSLEAEK